MGMQGIFLIVLRVTDDDMMLITWGLKSFLHELIVPNGGWIKTPIGYNSCALRGACGFSNKMFSSYFGPEEVCLREVFAVHEFQWAMVTNDDMTLRLRGRT